jgi:hypothetical protein
VFRADRDFIVNRLDSQGQGHVARTVLKIANQGTALAPQFLSLALPDTRIRQHGIGLPAEMCAAALLLKILRDAAYQTAGTVCVHSIDAKLGELPEAGQPSR